MFLASGVSSSTRFRRPQRPSPTRAHRYWVLAFLALFAIGCSDGCGGPHRAGQPALLHDPGTPVGGLGDVTLRSCLMMARRFGITRTDPTPGPR